MSYAPNSLEAQKGALGEKIFKKLWRYRYSIKRPDDTFESGASIVDYVMSDNKDDWWFAEVKTQAAYPYGVENAPCYSFPKNRIVAYAQYANDNALGKLLFCVVDPTDGYVHCEWLAELLRGKIIARQYPVATWSKGLNCMCYYFHREQFSKEFAIEPDDLTALRILFGIDESRMSDELARYVEGILRGKSGQRSARATKQISALEKECGTTNVIEAVETEDEIYPCGVENFFMGNDDIGTFEYICEFARNLKRYGTTYEPDKNRVLGFDKAALWNELDYGTGLGEDDISDDAAIELKALRDEFGGDVVQTAICHFCVDNYDYFCDAVRGDYPLMSLSRVINGVCDKILELKKESASSETGTKNVDTCLPAAKQEPAELPYAVALTFGVKVPNGYILTVFATKDDAYLSYAQLKAAGVISEDEPKPYLKQLANYEGLFVENNSLFVFLRDRKNFDNDIYQWWACKGTNETTSLWLEFSERRDFALKHLGFALPEEWARLAKERDNVVGKLEDMPYFINRWLTYNMYGLTTTIAERNLAEFFSDMCKKICDERRQAVKLPVKVAKFPDKILGVPAGGAESPDGVVINFYDVDGKIFAHGAQLAVAAGYEKQGGATADYTNFSKAVAAVAQYYAVQRQKNGKPVRCVKLDDMPAILDEFAFNHTDNYAQYEKASTFARWWREQNFSFDKSAPQPDSIREMLGQVASSLNVDADDLSQAVLDLRQKAFEQEQTRLKDLLIRKK